MDYLDFAQQLETQEREARIKAARTQAPKGNGICRDCRESVETERATALRCLSCQQDEDRRERQRSGGRHA